MKKEIQKDSIGGEERHGKARLRTRREAAEYLRVSPATLSRWAQLRCGPRFVKLTSQAKSSVRYDLSDLDAFIKSATRSTSGPTD